MKNKLFSVLLTSSLAVSLVLAALLAQGCAHSQVQKNLDDKLAKVPNGENRAQLTSQAIQKISQDKDLTAEQKSKLESLAKETRTKTDQMSAEILKLRMVLVKDIVASDYDDTEVDLIKKRIRRLEQDKITEYFDAIRDTNVILGRWASRNQRVWSEYDTDFYNQVMMPGL